MIWKQVCVLIYIVFIGFGVFGLTCICKDTDAMVSFIRYLLDKTTVYVLLFLTLLSYLPCSLWSSNKVHEYDTTGHKLPEWTISKGFNWESMFNKDI